MPTPSNPSPYSAFDEFYSGMALTYNCPFGVDLHNDPDAKPVTVWKKNGTEIMNDERLNVTPPMKQHGITFLAQFYFKYLIADKDKGSYICENFVSSSADNEFIKQGNSSRGSFSLPVKGTLSTIMQNTLSSYMYMYMEQILMSKM